MVTGFWSANLEATTIRMNQTVLQFTTAAARPAAAAGQKGMVHIATDTLVLSYDNGGAWVILGTVVSLTTKGDITTFSTLPIRKGVGANDTVLKADSIQGDGLIWEKVVHSELTGIGVNDHHNQSHTMASHSDSNHATGSYTGDGTTSQGITGIGFQPKFVYITKRVTTDTTLFGLKEVLWTSDVIVDDNASGLAIDMDSGAGRTRTIVNAIISLDADGFTVDDNGVDQDPNINTVVYNFWAIG